MWSIALALTLASSIFIDDQMSSASSRANAPLGATFQAGYAIYGNGTWAVEFFTINTSSFTESKKLSIMGSNGGFALKKIESKPASGSISSLNLALL